MKKIRIILISLVVLMLMGCSVARSVSDSTMVSRNNYVEHISVDSIFVHDSVFVREKADTVFYTKYHTLYKERLRVDTIMCSDTVFCDREVYVESKTAVYSWKPFFFSLICCASLFILWKTGVLRFIWNWILILYKLCIRVFLLRV